MNNKEYHKAAIEFINTLEGYKTLYKNLHWSASNLTIHRLDDDLLSDIIEFQDTIAETSMGYLGYQFGIGEVKPIGISSDKPDKALKMLITKVDAFCDMIENEKSLRGVTNAVNDFQQSLLKYQYLFILANKDGQTNTAVTIK